MFALTRRAAKAGETSLQPPAGEKLLDTVGYDATQRTRAGLEALLVRRDITVEVLLEHLIENSGFRMTGAVNPRGIADPNGRIRRAEMRVLNSCILGLRWQQKGVSHGPQSTSCGPGI